MTRPDELPTTPSWTVPVTRQLLLLLESGRVWILLLAVIGPVLFIEAMRLRSVAASGAPDLYSQIPSVVLAVEYLIYVAPAWGLLIWHGEVWDERLYHWSLPISQPVHDLMRVAAGAVWLVTASLLGAAVGLMLALLAGQTVVLELGHVFWLNFVTYPITFYLAATLLPLTTSKPIARGVTILGVLAAVLLLGQWFDIGFVQASMNTVVDGELGMRRAIDGGLSVEAIQAGSADPVTSTVHSATTGEWFAAMAIWLGLPLAGVVVGAHRRR